MSMNEGLIDSNITSLGICPDYYLYAGTYLAGMHRFDLSTGIKEIAENTNKNILIVWPNPFRERLNIKLQMPNCKFQKERSQINLSVYDATGRWVRSFCITPDASRTAHLSWDGTNDRGQILPGGVYLIKLMHDGHSEVRSVLGIR